MAGDWISARYAAAAKSRAFCDLWKGELIGHLRSRFTLTEKQQISIISPRLFIIGGGPFLHSRQESDRMLASRINCRG